MGKKLVDLKSEYYILLSKKKVNKAAKIRKELLALELARNIAGKTFKPRHIVT